ncbi:hypothetical protein E3Q11_02257 [Wallemia mellicola]|nr:hypothetical protein E3Q11_02257 [Wallemia mellicola]TIC74364.1 hypothetical protein E3Q00_01975 [Wallemia mellicola]
MSEVTGVGVVVSGAASFFDHFARPDLLVDFDELIIGLQDILGNAADCLNIFLSFGISDGGMHTTIKLGDGSYINRNLLSRDFLNLLFNDESKVFYGTTFFDLYLRNVISSTKCTKSTRDKLIADKEYAKELTKVLFLINVNRINTTLGFYHEMKTALRVYNSIPSMRNYNHQFGDSPRLKTLLKSIDYKSNVSNLVDLQLNKQNDGNPPTSLVNFLFILMQSAEVVNRNNLPSGIALHDLIWPSNIPSKQKAQAFLWLVYNYYVKNSDDFTPSNPFNDEFSLNNPGKSPTLERVPEAQLSNENVDTPEEIEWGLYMQKQRQIFLSQLNESQGDNSDIEDVDTNVNKKNLFTTTVIENLSKPYDNYNKDSESYEDIQQKLKILEWIGGKQM